MGKDKAKKENMTGCKQEELTGMVDAKTDFVVDALLEGKILRDEGTIKEEKRRLEEALEKLHAVKLTHGWFILRNSLNEAITFD